MKQVFIFGTADRCVFVHCPPGRNHTYGPDGKPLCYEIVGSCYGSLVAPSRWHVQIHNAMIEHGFRQSTPLTAVSTLLKVIFECWHTPTIVCHCSLTQPTATPSMLLLSTCSPPNSSSVTMVSKIAKTTWACPLSLMQITKQSSSLSRCKLTELLAHSNLDTCNPSFATGVPKALVSDRDCPSHDDIDHYALLLWPLSRTVDALVSCYG